MKPDLAGRIALAAAVACLMMVGVTIGALAMPAVRAKLGMAPVSTPSYATGEQIAVPAAVYDASSYTVILFVRSDCGVCQQMKPWLTSLTTAMQDHPSVRVVAVASGERPSDDINYAAELGIGRERVFQLAPDGLKLRQVPSVVLVDQHGVVRYCQDGAPGANRDQVVQTMASVIVPR